jgi:hypothetical protein
MFLLPRQVPVLVIRSDLQKLSLPFRIFLPMDLFPGWEPLYRSFRRQFVLALCALSECNWLQYLCRNIISQSQFAISSVCDMHTS